MLFHNKYSPPIRTVCICCMSSLLSHSYLNYSVLLVCLASPDCYPGILQIKDFFPLESDIPVSTSSSKDSPSLMAVLCNLLHARNILHIVL